MSNTNDNLALVLSDAIQNNQFDDAFVAIKGLRPVDRAEVFTYFEPEQQVRLAREFPRATLAALVSEMPADERTDLFKRFDQNQRDA